MKRQIYIASPATLKRSYTRLGYWTAVDKVSISSIKVNKRYFSYPNQVNVHQVERILEYFNPAFWSPIVVNEKFYLLDGQHRLEVAKRMRLKYIDVVVQSKELEKTELKLNRTKK